MNLTTRIAATFNRSGAARDNVVGAAAMPAVSRGSNGSGAPSSRRLRAGLAALALAIAAFAATAASASAAPLAANVDPISEVSYTSAHVTGKISSPGVPEIGGTEWIFQYSKNPGTEGWTNGPGDFIGGPGFANKSVFGDIKELKGATKYFVRLVVSIPFGPTAGTAESPAPNPSFTTLTVDPPSIIATDDASGVFSTSAKATGKVKRPANGDAAFNISACRFEFVADTDFSTTGFASATPVPCDQATPFTAPNGETDVTAALTGLSPSTTYHLRLAVENAAPGVVTKEAAHTFTTDPAVAKPTIVSVDNASDVEYTVASVSGEVERPDVPDPAADVACRFEYVTQEQFEAEEFAAAEPNGQIVGCIENPITEASVNGDGKQQVSSLLSGLALSTTYHLRLSASNQGGSDAKEAPATFTTQGPAPAPSVLSIDNASELHIHSAKVTGSVERPAGKDSGLDVNCRFEYVTQAQFELEGFAAAEPYGQVVGCEPEAEPAENPIHAEGKSNVKATLGLAPGTTYHLRLVASNVGGTETKEAAATFTTRIPVLTLDPPTIGYTSADVSGTVNPEGPREDGTALEGSFQYSTEPDNPDSWIKSNVTFGGVSGPFEETNPLPFAGTIKGLKPGTTYSFRLIASNNGDVNVTSPQPYPEATTKPVAAPTATLDPVTDITANSAHFSGTVNANAPGPLDALGEAAYETAWHIECVPACTRILPAGSGSGVVKAGEGAKAISVDASELEANKSYEVKLIATNAGGTSAPEQPFSTPLVKPTVKQGAGGSDGKGGYTLQGTVNPNNSKVTKCEFLWGPDSAKYAFAADCSPMPGEKAKAVTVEAHLTGLNVGSHYHALLVATNAAGEAKGVDQEFVPTLDPPQNCPNEQLRKENSSEALPECRAYEQVTPVIKGGLDTSLGRSSDDGAVLFGTEAGNLANSGGGFPTGVTYVAARSDTGWETLANLNGPSRSVYAEPENFVDTAWRPTYSSDLRSSLWYGKRKGETETGIFLRKPDGRFSFILGTGGNLSGNQIEVLVNGASNDFSHAVFANNRDNSRMWQPDPGLGVYDLTLTGPDAGQRRRADVDNAGNIISTCEGGVLFGRAGWGISGDGRAIFVNTFGGCGGSNPPVNEVWVRVDGTTSYKASASQCTRTAADPGGACNAPADANFEGAATADGSRVFFTTAQQLLNSDTDETRDLYACDIPTTPQAPTGLANPCAPLRQLSAGEGEARVEGVLGRPEGEGAIGSSVSEDGSTIYFTAKGVLADNENALDEKAVAGDKNFYVWRQDTAHPEGQTSFIAVLPESNDEARRTQITPDGRYFVLRSSGQLTPTDTDEAYDLYRYDAEMAQLTRVSTGILGGAGGNAEGLDAGVRMAITDDGSGIVFDSSEALSALDGNGALDVYFWREGQRGVRIGDRGVNPQIDGSGQNIYFETATQLSAADKDSLVDVYDARVGGGFSFTEPKACSGEACQGPAPAPPGAKALETEKPGAGNPAPQPKCAKGKVLKKGKCVRKATKKHHAKKGKRTASNNRGGNK